MAARKKSTARRSSKTTRSRKSTGARKRQATVEITEALVKKIIKDRKAGMPWQDVRDKYGTTRAQGRQIRAMMHELAPGSVASMGPGTGKTKESGSKKKSTARRKSTAKKTTAKKSTGKKRARRVARGAGGAKKARRPDLESMEDQALLDSLVGRTVSFHKNAADKDRSRNVEAATVREAKMLPENRKWGRIVQMRLDTGRTHSVPLDWIIKVA